MLIFCVQTIKCLQVLLFNTDNSSQHYSLICTQSNGSKNCYIIPIIQFLHTVKRFQVFHTNSFICTQLNGSKYCYGTLTIRFIIIYLQTVKWSNSSIWSIDMTQLNTIIPSQSRPEIICNDGVLHIQHRIVYCHILDTHWVGGVIPLQRCIQCIL